MQSQPYWHSDALLWDKRNFKTIILHLRAISYGTCLLAWSVVCEAFGQNWNSSWCWSCKHAKRGAFARIMWRSVGRCYGRYGPLETRILLRRVSLLIRLMLFSNVTSFFRPGCLWGNNETLSSCRRPWSGSCRFKSMRAILRRPPGPFFVGGVRAFPGGTGATCPLSA